MLEERTGYVLVSHDKMGMTMSWIALARREYDTLRFNLQPFHHMPDTASG